MSLVTRQQKQQQGNQLAKETDRLMKTYTSLPVGPDQVIAETSAYIHALLTLRTEQEGRFTVTSVFCLFSLRGKGRYKKNAC